MNRLHLMHALRFSFSRFSTRQATARLFAVLTILSGWLFPPAVQAAQTFVQPVSGDKSVYITATATSPKDGSIYVAGYYQSESRTAGPNFGPISTSLPGTPLYSGFLAKMGPDGAWQWAVPMADWTLNATLYVRSITVSRDNVYLCGETTKGVWVAKPFRGARGEQLAYATGSRFDESTSLTPYVVKFDTDGNAIWSAVASNKDGGTDPRSADASGEGIAVDQSGNVFVCGSFRSGVVADAPASGVGNGLNFGRNHAFRARDQSGSGTTSSGTDWNTVTRDGYVAKLDSSGNWQWVAVAGGLEDGPFGYPYAGLHAICVDTVGNLYVTGTMANGAKYVSGALWHKGMTASTWNSSSVGGVGLQVADNTSSAWTGKIGGSGDKDGQWLAQAPAITGDSYGLGVTVANGTVYTAIATRVSSANDLEIDRYKADLSQTVDWTFIGNTTVGESLNTGNCLASDRDGNLYLAGTFGYPQTDFLGTKSRNELAVSKLTAYCAQGRNLFVAKADKDLNWQWVKTANDPTPTGVKTPVVSVDSIKNRVFFGDSFYSGTLTLGPDESSTSTTVGSSYIGVVSALVTDTGGFLSQLSLEMISDFGGAQVSPAVGVNRYFEGADVKASVPPILYEDVSGASIDPSDDLAILNRAVVRHICVGYQLLGTAVSGSTASYGFTIGEDSRVQFNWKTEYALEIKNDLSGGLGGLTSTAAGNPDPNVQKHWVESGVLTTAFIDGVIPSPNPNEFGARYRSTGFQASGSGVQIPILTNVLALNGVDEYVNLGTLPPISFANGVTAEAWVYYDKIPTSWGGIFEFASLDTDANSIFLSNPDNTPNLQFRAYYAPGQQVGLTAINVLKVGQWTHVAASVDTNGNAALYVNGQTVASGSFPPGKLPPTAARNRSFIGYGEKSGLSPFPGKIGEVRLWNTSRTVEQIRLKMLAALAGNESGLVGYWKMTDLKSGNVVSDISPTGANGTGRNIDGSNIVPGGITSFFQPWASLQSRQQVPQFSMSGPVAVQYSWTKENSIRVSASPSALESLPRTASDTASYNGSGEYWFTTGSRVKVYAPLKPANPAGYQLSSQNGQYIGGVGDVLTATGNGQVDPKDSNQRFVEIPSLDQGSALTWNYAQRVYQGATVVIGSAIDGTKNGAGAVAGTFAADLIPASEGIDMTKSPTGTTIVSNAPPGSTVQDMWIWDDVDKKLYPLRPGTVRLEWPRVGGGDPILTDVTFAFPTDPSYPHVANTPAVPLDDDKTDNVALVGMKYSERSTAVVNGANAFEVADDQFSAPFWTVLVFSQTTDQSTATGDLTRERILVRTVRTKKYSDGLIARDATVGTEILSSSQDIRVPHNGYVYWPQARYNASIYDRSSQKGPIIPVNIFPTAKTEEKLVVVWYTQRENINWPEKVFQYNPAWPQAADRIVVASRLGSEGVTASGNVQRTFPPARYSEVKIYNQPDRAQPGYNPNEEHAVVRPSLLSTAVPVPAAFALRRDLNSTNLDDRYTSDPFVLVQFFDQQVTNYGMAVYQVQIDDQNLPSRRLEFAPGGTTGDFVALNATNALEFNRSSTPWTTLLRDGEPVDLEVNGNLAAVVSGRYFLTRISDFKFNLSATPGGPLVKADAISPNADYAKVVVTRSFPYTFDYTMKAGQPVLAPYPLQDIIGATACDKTTGENLDSAQLVYWEDHKKQPWAVSGSFDGTKGLRAQFYYPVQPDFWSPGLSVGTCIPFVSFSAPQWVVFKPSWPVGVAALKAGESLTYSGGEINADNGNAKGLPGIVGWAGGKIVYDGANPSMDPAQLTSKFLGRVASPLLGIEVPLAIKDVPAAIRPGASPKTVTVNGSTWSFDGLDASLGARVYYDPVKQVLGVRGYLNAKTVGDPALTASPGALYLLQPNTLTPQDLDSLKLLHDDAKNSITPLGKAVAALFQLSRDPAQANPGGYGVGLEPIPGQAGKIRPASLLGPGLALFPNQGLLDPTLNLPEGFLTLAENDHDLLGDAPVVLHIIKVRKQPLFRGAIKTIAPPNAFDEKVTLRHSGDFGANSGDLVFDWYYRPDDGTSALLPDQDVTKWKSFPSANSGLGAQEINLRGATAALLADNLFFVRWRHKNNLTGWSEWAGAANSRPPIAGRVPPERPEDTYIPQLAEGWIKRVLAAVNPFDARITDFRNNDSPATYSSMVQQAGAPYNGNIALNADKNVVENAGLIQLYSTLLDRAKSLSIDIGAQDPAVNNSILLAASRIADLYLLLGNEAYSDAQDPTIGFGSDSVEYGALAPTIFAFQNQVPTLLEEELSLLRGTAGEGAFPSWNRLLWNFTRGEGEAAYALSYRISDANQDGFINEDDARILYPQGHGDAWGHYLSALKGYYDLNRHKNYNWPTRSEKLSIGGVVIDVDYLDERKFAQAAAAKAKAGAEIVNLTYRSKFVDDPDGQWQGYVDTDTDRAWGVTDWARRAGCGALYDWAVANALLPASDNVHTGIQKVDRTTVKELSEIAAQAAEIRKQLDSANGGLNPLGLANDVVPFDIDPVGLDPSGGAAATHFEQVYARALKALQNGLELFNNANQLNNMLRQTAATAEQFASDATAQDLDFRNRLIEVFGTPYDGTIGPGKAYPAGYTGPDLYLYMYVDVTGLQNVPPASKDFTNYFKPMDGGFVNTGAAGGGGNSIDTVWSHYFTGDAPNLADNTKTDFSDVLALNMPQTASGYSFQAPTAWGSRRAPGEIQQVLSELVQAEADLQLALHDYDGVIGDIKDMVQLIRAQSAQQADTIKIQENGVQRTTSLQAAIIVADSVAATVNFAAELASETADATAETLPTSVGLASDVTAPARGAIELSGAFADNALKGVAYAAERTAVALEGTKEIGQMQDELKIQKAEFKYAMQEQLKEFESLLGDEAKARIEAFRRQEALRQVSDKYRGLVESGLRILDERTLHNKKTAAATQQNRYQDLTFRIVRNEALSKYRAAFDLAARYAYLAAKAYDYETNLDPNDPASARPMLTRIVNARTLGAVDNGEPRVGSGGLADALATLKVNFDVLKTQMGFNNPQTEGNRFSLRNELFRILPGPMSKGVRDESPTETVNYDGRSMTAEQAWKESDRKWRDALQNSSGGFSSMVMTNLWLLPEFRRYCRPFAPESSGAQPGLVITFGSQVVFGKNFFGKPLGPGDSSYDPSHFATKVRSVGMWFDNYNGDGLSFTPRAYLLPAGLDIMTIPTSGDLTTREWNIVDQKIPIPLPVAQGDLKNPAWIPLQDSLNGTIAEIRRYSMFRAYHDAGFDPSEVNFDSRVIGRSVWNTRWMLIIPGGTFLADQTDGLDTFINGLKSSTGPVVDSRGQRRDGNGVRDIKLYFQTYAYSGN